MEKNPHLISTIFLTEEWNTRSLISLDPLVIAGIFRLIVISEEMIGGIIYHRN